MITWAKSILKLNDSESFSHCKTIVDTPWSTVIEINIDDACFYLKHTPEALALEAEIIQVLHNKFQASVPTVIARNAKLNCFLMKDAGKPLRGLLKQEFNLEPLCKGVENFASMQVNVAEQVELFLDIGVPDWRLDKLPYLFQQLLTQKELLTADGLSGEKIKALEEHISTVSMLCEALSNYGIQQTIVQPDFQDNNMLIDEASQNITIIDLGEVVISHPFFSLVICLWQLQKHYYFSEESDEYQKIQKTFLDKHKLNLSKSEMQEALLTAKKLWPVYEALAQYRLMVACGVENILVLQRKKLSSTLIKLLN